MSISNNSEWVTYTINPSKGDGKLFLLNPDTGYKKSIDRGSGARLSPNSDFSNPSTPAINSDVDVSKIKNSPSFFIISNLISTGHKLISN